MTERTAPDAGTLACPFVAFDDDRDERSDQPDHRHRCYAEIRPAPRAIAHQAAFCLSGEFAACPTFQDWARREAARSRDAAAAGALATAGAADPADDEQPERNPHRDWAAPPPWVGDPGTAGSRPAAEPVAPAFLTKSTRSSAGDDVPGRGGRTVVVALARRRLEGGRGSTARSGRGGARTGAGRRSGRPRATGPRPSDRGGGGSSGGLEAAARSLRSRWKRRRGDASTRRRRASPPRRPGALERPPGASDEAHRPRPGPSRRPAVARSIAT